jgi:hypothetical protein
MPTLTNLKHMDKNSSTNFRVRHSDNAPPALRQEFWNYLINLWKNKNIDRHRIFGFHSASRITAALHGSR